LKPNNFEKFIGSGFLSGYIPFAPGTFGSLAALLIYLIPGFENPTIMLIFISLTTIAGFYISNKFENEYGKDPPQCTIDEFVGTWISLLFIPKILWLILIDFVIWRVLDILKPFPARQLEKLNGGLGIMIDDIISGVYSLIIVHIFIFFVL